MKKIIGVVFVFFFLAPTLTFGEARAASEIIITKADIEKAGSSIPATAIGEPVSSVKLYPPRWVDSANGVPACAVVEGSIFPIDPNGWPINFRVVLPARWSYQAMQIGGAGMNGMILVLPGGKQMIGKEGFVLYGSDSGHQSGGMRGMGGSEPLATGPGGISSNDWAVNEEAIKNFGYLQMKKTHDAAMVIIERVYGERPHYNYFVGMSQGGREALTVAQRFPADYDGIVANVPVLNFSTLSLAPELIRIQEKSMANWVTPAKVNAIRAEFLRQCDKLDGLADGIINNYIASRALFNVNDGTGPSDPWAALRAPNGIDPDPGDASPSARLTDGQIKTLEFCYSSYNFSTPLANGVKTFGMWLPTIEPDGFGIITGIRYLGQEGAEENASMYTTLGVLGVTGFLMQNIKANPLDYIEGGSLNKRREEISEWLDATNPDLSAFYRHGGKLIVTIGAMDNIASPGAQLDYYQSVLEKMGNKKVDDFARLFVAPQGGHGLSGKSYKLNGDGQPVPEKKIPGPDLNDQINLIIAWVENKQAPSKTLVIDPQGHIGVKPEGKGFLLCSYPGYPKYIGGPVEMVSSYKSSLK